MARRRDKKRRDKYDEINMTSYVSPPTQGSLSGWGETRISAVVPLSSLDNAMCRVISPMPLYIQHFYNSAPKEPAHTEAAEAAEGACGTLMPNYNTTLHLRARVFTTVILTRIITTTLVNSAPEWKRAGPPHGILWLLPSRTTETPSGRLRLRGSEAAPGGPT